MSTILEIDPRSWSEKSIINLQILWKNSNFIGYTFLEPISNIISILIWDHKLENLSKIILAKKLKFIFILRIICISCFSILGHALHCYFNAHNWAILFVFYLQFDHDAIFRCDCVLRRVWTALAGPKHLLVKFIWSLPPQLKFAWHDDICQGSLVARQTCCIYGWNL